MSMSELGAPMPPVLLLKNIRGMLGAAGNVARNISALGGKATLIGLLGRDRAGAEVTRAATMRSPMWSAPRRSGRRRPADKRRDRDWSDAVHVAIPAESPYLRPCRARIPWPWLIGFTPPNRARVQRLMSLPPTLLSALIDYPG